MPRTVKDNDLATREARARLKPRHKPYFRLISEGRHIGYRKGKVKRGKTPVGKWSARLYRGAGDYVTEVLGEADDVRDADGGDVLSFAQAQARAHEWFADQGTKPADRNLTVDDALDAYVKWYKREKRGIPSYRHSLRSLERSIDNHIRPRLGTIPLADLTFHDSRGMRDDIAAQPAMVRGMQRFRAQSDDPEDIRRRKVTANKILNIYKAAMNRAFFEDKAFDGALNGDEAWRRVKPFPDVDKPVREYLTDDECVRFINACAPDFRPLAQAAILTGGRYGELTKMRMKDFDADAEVVHIRNTKSGRERNVYLSDDAVLLFDRLAMDKTRDDLVFQKSDGGPWGASHQRRPMQKACGAAKIGRSIRFHDLRHTFASHLAIKGVPMAMIADQLGHADTRMTEKHYAHLAPSVVADTVRAAMVGRGIVERDNVKKLRPEKVDVA